MGAGLGLQRSSRTMKAIKGAQSRTLDEIRERIRELRESGKHWTDPIWKEIWPEAPRGTLCRILKDPTYIPFYNKTRRKLGLPDFVLVEVWEGYKIRHERLVKPNGGKALKERRVRCPHCKQEFPERGNVVKPKKRPAENTHKHKAQRSSLFIGTTRLPPTSTKGANARLQRKNA